MKYRTISAYVSGSICGQIWWPTGAKCGVPFNGDLRAQFGRYSDKSGATFRDALLSILNENGGDFQSASFSADTVVRVERRYIEAPGKYQVHIWERELSEIGCADLADEEAFTCDFMPEYA